MARLLNHLERPRALEVMLVVTSVSGMLASVVISRALGPTGRGLVTTLVVWSQLIGWVAAFSLDKAVVVLSQSDREDRMEVTPAFLLARRYIAILAVPTIALTIVIGGALFHDWIWSAMLTLGAIATSFGEIGAGWLLARKKMGLFVLYRVVQSSVYMVLVVVLALLLRGHSYAVRLDAMAVSVVISLIVPVAIVHLRAPFRMKERVDGRKLRSFAATTQLSSAMTYLNSRLDILCLSIFSTPERVGIYAVGLAAGQAAVVLGTAGIVRGITGSAKSMDRNGVVWTLLLGLTIAALSPLIIPWVFGAVFEPSVRVAQIIGVGASVNYALQSTDGRLLGAGKPSLVAIAEAAGAAAFGIGIAISLNLEVVALADVGSFAVSLVIAQIFLHRIGDRNGSDSEIV
jgi:O-antigen/teichoic acid export membrane protein